MMTARIFGHAGAFALAFSFFFFATVPVLGYHAAMRLAALAGAIAIASCASAPARLSYGTLESAAVHDTMQYAIYAPPDWKPGESLPLVVFLHGGGDAPNCF